MEVEAGDFVAVRALEARRREALGAAPAHDNVHTLLLKYRCACLGSRCLLLYSSAMPQIPVEV